MRGRALSILRWVGSARADLRAFPEAPRTSVGYALWVAQNRGKAENVKPLKGIAPGAGVLEVVEQHGGNAYRAVYTVRFQGVVYVLHAFRKKSRSGIRTPRHELELIRNRYRAAAADYEARGRE